MTPIIIPIFLPHIGCPNQCIFCNQRTTVKDIPSPSYVERFIESSIKTLPSAPDRKREIAFYGGSFTAMRRDEQISYLEKARTFLLSGLIDSLRISTRPDAIDEEKLILLKNYGVGTVEIGTQSLIDEVLQLSNRGHDSKDTINSINLLKSFGFEVGVHLMIGLPGDNFDYFLKSVEKLIDLRVNFLRIHPTLVLKGAPLENLWRAKKYTPLSLNEAIKWLKAGVLKLENESIPIVRIGLQPTKEMEDHLIAGPYHPAIHQMVRSAIYLDRVESLLERYQDLSSVILLCNPREVSNLRGQKNQNLLKLKEKYGIKEILIEVSEAIESGSIRLKIL